VISKKDMQIKIVDRLIGRDCSPFIIAEAGINHNGELEKALAMIEVAKKAGADAIKFQTFRAEDFVSDPTVTYTYRSQGQEVTESMLEMFKKYEFTREQWFLLKKKSDEQGILFLSTPQNPSDLKLLLEIGVPAIKVGSDDFTNLHLLKNYAQTCLPMIVSCGMADLAEVYQALDAIGSLDGYPTVLMLCTSEYPTPPEDVHLLKLKTLAAAFPTIILGFSDHTQGPLASGLAVALGAVVFEKHFTLDHNLPGPDHWFSEDPDGLSEWVSTIRKSFRILGQSLVKPTAAEMEMRILARRSIVALTDLERGETLTGQNMGLKRPGSGLPPVLYEQLLGRKTTRKIARGALIKMGDFE
jgi:N,N'-diacetyllegionaminate synthase